MAWYECSCQAKVSGVVYVEAADEDGAIAQLQLMATPGDVVVKATPDTLSVSDVVVLSVQEQQI